MKTVYSFISVFFFCGFREKRCGNREIASVATSFGGVTDKVG